MKFIFRYKELTKDEGIPKLQCWESERKSIFHQSHLRFSPARMLLSWSFAMKQPCAWTCDFTQLVKGSECPVVIRRRHLVEFENNYLHRIKKERSKSPFHALQK